ncbi:hypothetical protein ACP70R_024872 [Stipagrostis hirtigluma subsp. patula]
MATGGLASGCDDGGDRPPCALIAATGGRGQTLIVAPGKLGIVTPEQADALVAVPDVLAEGCVDRAARLPGDRDAGARAREAGPIQAPRTLAGDDGFRGLRQCPRRHVCSKSSSWSASKRRSVSAEVAEPGGIAVEVPGGVPMRCCSSRGRRHAC